ncbi:hypothetical protein M5K25_009579 [Dendrobium thyrsiflorum]|uniref:SNARE-interacting protein KEULE n=1 Tax=Dendrobium thyrsiflorum TaxID=117978 RepID=A0ABD0VCW2_DENTH
MYGPIFRTLFWVGSNSGSSLAFSFSRAAKSPLLPRTRRDLRSKRRRGTRRPLLIDLSEAFPIMSMSDSDFSSGGDYKNFRQITRDRLLYEMLRSTMSKDSKARRKVLIMDKLTTKIMSCACKMTAINEEGVSLVEDINKRRQPMPSMDAIYFVQPTKENVTIFMSDISGRSPLYKRAYVFFSSPISKELVNHIKSDGSALARIAALSEMNLEYIAIDGQGFITGHERALEDLFSDNAEISQAHNACIHNIASRISTVFASLREFPYVRYRAAKSSLDASTMTTLGDLIPTKLAAAVWHCLAKYKAMIPDFPQIETCELLILDRSVDQIAPIIHEWTYDAMCHDLLNMEGNKYVQEVPSKTGSTSEKKEFLLEDDHDPIWRELRHAHIADASERLHEKMSNFISRNKAAQIHHNSRHLHICFGLVILFTWQVFIVGTIYKRRETKSKKSKNNKKPKPQILVGFECGEDLKFQILNKRNKGGKRFASIGDAS